MMQEPRRPDFFMVGAPKCGTTAMTEYLRRHPQIFIPPVKEVHFFGSDLTFRFSPRITQTEYLSLFAPAPVSARIGESSVRYLQSRNAAREIEAFSPGSQILVMLRDPVDMMYAMHSELLFSGMEDISSFEEALRAEPARRAGERIPPGTNVPEMLFYRESVRYAEQIQRYLDVFGSERVRVILLDDMRADALGVYRETLKWLGVGEYVTELNVVNAAKAPRSKAVRRVVSRPPTIVRQVARQFIPRATRKRIYQSVLRLNARPMRRPPLEPRLRASLVRELTPGIRTLEDMLERDLGAWTQ